MHQTQLATDWHAQRRHLNHDWLKKVFIVKVGAALNLVRGDLRDPEEARFFSDLLSEWEAKKRELESLGRQTETALSPREWLAYQPLNALPEATLIWLGEVVHGLWLRDVPVATWVGDLESAIREAEERYRAVKELKPPPVAFGREDLGRALQDFGVACERLATVLSSFPSGVSAA